MAQRKTGKSKTSPSKSSLVRLNKYIADCGIASRRKADELIESGKVLVNGKKNHEMGTKINPLKDTVIVKGKKIFPVTEKLYFMFNKPTSVVTSMDDPHGRTTVADYFKVLKRKRVFPVGRLDWDSEGLLLVTNDGEFSNLVTHPKEEIPKTYMVKLNGQPTMAQLDKLKRGVSIVGGKVKALHVEKIKNQKAKNKQVSDKYDWVKIVITEGKNRQVRKMFEKIGFDVIKLQRIAIGDLKLGKLKKGAFVELTSVHLLKIFKQPDFKGTASKPDKTVKKTTRKTIKKKTTSRKKFTKKTSR